jgi:hypothetical protein
VRRFRLLVVFLAFVLAASLINPYGPLMWVYLLRAVTMERPYIVEWWSPRIADFGQLWSGFPFMLGITIIGVAYALISRRRAIFRQGWLLLAVTCYLGLRHMRHLTFFGLTAAVFSLYPFLLAIKSGYHAAYRRLKITIRPALTQAAAFVADMAVYPAALAVAGYLIATSNLQVKVDPYAYPVWAIEFIRTNRIAGNLLLPFNWSSYALWKLHPQCRVSLDGRYESVYTEQAAEDVDEFMYGFSNWTVMLEKYSNNAIMVFVHGESYSNMLTRADWTNIYNDYLAGLFVPTSAAPAGFIWTPPGSNHDFSAEKYISSMGGP